MGLLLSASLGWTEAEPVDQSPFEVHRPHVCQRIEDPSEVPT